ncbi:MAG: hypothetical protein BLM47_09740 [Candidatus Reconcilbacillus cellulovorans]|uniref:Pilus assembly protein TadE n=1 Tax=Candidatus Reconcilbacillus cellulovorans TaxID=1906605 RepID=A0A2A6DZL0_9BACL|nr:MAG: hypothetical protein BLM47_09740 [Candidatus Reconcilbacillus cellulovorans]
MKAAWSCSERLMRRIKNWLKNESAVLTLEAALVFPVVASLFLTGIAVARKAEAKLALQAALSDSVRTVAAHSYAAKAAADDLPADIAQLFDSQLFDASGERRKEGFFQLVADFVWEHADKRILQRSSLRVTAVEIPDIIVRNGEPYVEIAAEYVLRPIFPFGSYRIVVRAYASERCWIGA